MTATAVEVRPFSRGPIFLPTGEEAAEDWARGVAANFARRPQGNDTSQINAVATGEAGEREVTLYLQNVTALQAMQEHGVGRLPVVDEGENLIGIVSKTDLMTAFDIIQTGGTPSVISGRRQGAEGGPGVF